MDRKASWVIRGATARLDRMMACTICAAGVKPGEGDKRGGRGLVARIWMYCAALARVMCSSAGRLVVCGDLSLVIGNCSFDVGG